MIEKENVRLTILNNATKLFISEGYNNTTLRKIADLSNITRGHLYYYFKKKEDILMLLYKNLVRNIYSLINKVLNINELNKMNPIFRYSLIMKVYLETIIREPNILRIYVEATKIDELRKEYVRFMDDFFKELITADFKYKKENELIDLSSIVSVAGEFELINYFYENTNNFYCLDVITNSIVRTRLSLLKFDASIIDDTIEKSTLEFEKLKSKFLIDKIIEEAINIKN